MENSKTFRVTLQKRFNLEQLSIKDDKISSDDKTNANIFKEFFYKLISDLATKLPPPSNKFGIGSVRNYYQNILDFPSSKFKFLNVTEEFALKVLKNRDIDKAAGINNLFGKFLKD